MGTGTTYYKDLQTSGRDDEWTSSAIMANSIYKEKVAGSLLGSLLDGCMKEGNPISRKLDVRLEGVTTGGDSWF